VWFLASKEILNAKSRYALLTGLVALIAFLVFVMTGLASGLGNASVSGLRTLTDEATLVAYAPSVQRSLGRSDIDAGLAPAAARSPEVAAAPVGQSMVNLRTGAGATVTVALVGVPEDPRFVPADRVPGPDEVLLDHGLAGEHEVGEQLVVQPGGRTLTVAGFADLGSLQHTPVAYTPLPTWQRVRHAPFAAADAPAPNRASALLITTAGGVDPSTARAELTRHADLDVVTSDEAVAASPGYQEETGTISLIRGLLLAIAALLVGTVFWILTLQKEGSLAVLRAAGARPALLLGTYLLQVTATTAVGIGAGVAAARLAAIAMPTTAYLLTTTDVVVAAVALTVLALGASAASIRRLVGVDPILSLGRI
jgi:putative ABC transport system permease protein